MELERQWLCCGRRCWTGSQLNSGRYTPFNHRVLMPRLFFVSLAFGLTCSACGGDDDSLGRAAPHLRTLEEELTADAAVRYGSAEGPGALGAIKSARLTSDGRYVVILDRDAPYLKVFDKTGVLRGAYIERGGGPLEMVSAAALAVDNSRAFVIGMNALAVVTLDGEHQLKTIPDFTLVDLGVDCDDRIVGYGPRGGIRPSFLHSMRVDSALRIIGSALEGERPRRIGYGFGRSGVLRTSGGSLVSHRQNGSIVAVHYSCAGEVTDRPWSWALNELPSARPAPPPHEESTESAEVFTIDALAPINVGAAELPHGPLLWLEWRIVPPATPEELENPDSRVDWFVADSAAIRYGYTNGRYVLQDVGKGAVLFSADEPWPHVVAISPARLEELLAVGRTVRRRGR